MKQAPGRFFDKPAFREYVRLLGELHRLIREGRDESPEGETLREAMDAPGELLDDEEVAEAFAISAELYRVSTSTTDANGMPAPTAPDHTDRLKA
jgi:hypothetical protein